MQARTIRHNDYYEVGSDYVRPSKEGKRYCTVKPSTFAAVSAVKLVLYFFRTARYLEEA